MLGESANNNIDLSQPYDEQIHRGILWHGHPSQLDCFACYCNIVSIFSNMKHEIWHFSSFMGISQSLPSTAYIKMIDIWMIFTMMCPFFEILRVWLKDILKRDNMPPQGSVQGIRHKKYGMALCHRDGLNPSSLVTGIFLLEPSWVSLRCKEMIMLEISV